MSRREERKPIERMAPLKRSGFLRRTGRIPPASPKRRRQSTKNEAIRVRVFERDDWTCRAAHHGVGGPCFGPHTPHHILKASQGGKYEENNLATLCAHHNDLIEQDATFAATMRSLGYVRRSWEAAA